MPITEFRGQYAFLSNFYECEILLDINGERLRFRNAEAAFQAFKDPSRAHLFQNMEGPTAKNYGRHGVKLPADWNQRRLYVMGLVVYEKFRQNPDLRAKLLATNAAGLVEGNTWHDTFWGKCDGKGQNHLGKILMETRKRLQSKYQPGQAVYGFVLDDGIGPQKFHVEKVLFPDYDDTETGIVYKVHCAIPGGKTYAMLMPEADLTLPLRDMLYPSIVWTRPEALAFLTSLDLLSDVYVLGLPNKEDMVFLSNKPHPGNGDTVTCVHAGCISLWNAPSKLTLIGG